MKYYPGMKRENANTCCNMDEVWKRTATWKNAIRKNHLLYDSLYMKCSEQANLLGTIDSKPRQKVGGRMFQLLTQQSWAWSDKIARHSKHHQQNHDSTEGGEPLQFCVLEEEASVAIALAKKESLYWLRKKTFVTVHWSQGMEGGEGGKPRRWLKFVTPGFPVVRALRSMGGAGGVLEQLFAQVQLCIYNQSY